MALSLSLVRRETVTSYYDRRFRFSLAAEYFRSLSKRPPTRNWLGQRADTDSSIPPLSLLLSQDDKRLCFLQGVEVFDAINILHQTKMRVAFQTHLRPR